MLEVEEEGTPPTIEVTLVKQISWYYFMKEFLLDLQEGRPCVEELPIEEWRPDRHEDLHH